jgi:hypothetical protein
MKVDDRLEIQDLISRYSYTYDENLIDEFMTLFADTAEVNLLTYSKGVEDIRKQVEKRRQHLSDEGIQPRHHQTVTILTEQTETIVQGKTYVLLTWCHKATSELEVKHSGMYNDEFIKTDSGWKFSKRMT